MARLAKPVPAAAATGIRFGTITSFATDPDMVFVQYKKMTDGLLVNDGDPKAAVIWPNTRQSDYASFVGTNIVVPVLTVGGMPYVQQLPRWDIRTPDENDPRGECSTGV